ncbi:MAG: Ig-like domain-containing protein, partial [Bacteroidaceae bacterium]|nr:Ig-like domain-containing protein [Bacteroidaceae bacterium]
NDQRIYPVNGRSNWAYQGGSAAGNMKSFVSRILSDNAADQQLRQMWKDSRKEGCLDEKTLVGYVDSMFNEMEASANLNFIRWPILNQRVHQNVSALGSFEAEVDVLRNYIPTRLAWIDNYLGYEPGSIYTDTTFYITTPQELIEFSKAVREGAQYSNGYLENDLDMTGFDSQFQPIGNVSKSFRGTFDGQGHRIRNLHITGGEYTGFFGAVGGGANISNLVLDSSCSIQGSNYVGLIGGSSVGGGVNISHVGNEANVTATGVNAAGIIGCNKGSTAIFTITNCYNTGNITGNSESAAISGWVGSGAKIENCYNIGTITGYNYRNDFYRGSATALNSYSTSTTQVTRISTEDVEGGKLCYRLNNGVTLEPIWYQTLGEDAYPIFDNTHLVVLKSDDDTYYNVSNIAGDVNSNGVLDETDALWIAAYLTGEEPEGFEVVNADANLDSHIDVADIVTVRRVLSGIPLGTQPLTATLYSSNASVKAGGTRKVTVWFNTSRAATAYEADIVLSHGLSIQEGSFAYNTKTHTTSHITYEQIIMSGGQGTSYHVIVYAPDNTNLGATSGTAFTFTLVGANDFAGGTYEIKHQTFVAADGVYNRPDDASYEVSLAKTYVTDILLEPNSIEMVAGCDTTLSVTILPETATVKDLEWLSSDEGILTVSEGTITALSAGTAIVTARSTDGSNKQGTARVVVYSDATPVLPIEELPDGMTIYTLSGIRVDRITKTGIYIINGKKRLVKVE